MAGLYFFELEGLLNIEKHDSIKDSVAAENYLNYKISSIDKTCKDWAFWNSSYYFMDQKNSYYIEENLPESSFENLDINAILFFDSEGSFFYGRYYDLNEGVFTDIPASLTNVLLVNDFIQNPDVSGGDLGFIRAGEKIYMISVNPVLTNSLEGPAKGTLVMAREVSSGYMRDVSREINLDARILNLSGLRMPEDDSRKIAYDENLDKISVISVIYDIDNNPVAELNITEKRELFRLGLNTLLVHLVFAVITCILIIIILNYFIDSLIIRRLEYFSSELERIARENDYAARLQDKDDDEISSIINSANILLGTIQGNIKSLEMNNSELGRALLKKSDLIGELHHRVKNNLQYIISLLGIKSLKIKDETALEVINETTNRIKYLGMIHDDLYNKEDKESLLLKEHLHDLTNLIHDGVPKEKREKISFLIKGDEFEAELSYAIPLSTALYELLKNSVEHAFDENGGSIEIQLFKDDKGLTIIISDDGRGIYGQESQKFSFGLRTAREIITKQLHGTMENIDAEKGTSWKIVINTGLKKEEESDSKRDE